MAAVRNGILVYICVEDRVEAYRLALRARFIAFSCGVQSSSERANPLVSKGCNRESGVGPAGGLGKRTEVLAILVAELQCVVFRLCGAISRRIGMHALIDR